MNITNPAKKQGSSEYSKNQKINKRIDHIGTDIMQNETAQILADYTKDISLNMLLDAYGEALDYPNNPFECGLHSPLVRFVSSLYKHFVDHPICTLLQNTQHNRVENWNCDLKEFNSFNNFLTWLYDNLVELHKKWDSPFCNQKFIDLLFSMPKLSEDYGFCYYPCIVKMHQERITKTTLARALIKFGFTEDISRVMHQKLNGLIKKHNEPIRLHFLTDSKNPQEWVDNYSHKCDFYSCMSSVASAVQVYAHPDNQLDLAFITNDNEPLHSGNEILARTLINRENKTFIKIYGKITNQIILEKLLENLEYKENSTGHDNVKLLKIEDSVGIVCPYIDNINTLDVFDDYLLLNDEGAFGCQDTTGYLESQYTCDECGPNHDCDSDLTWVESEQIVVCDHCLDNEFFNSELSDEWYRERYKVSYLDYRGHRKHATEEELQNDSDFIELTHEYDGTLWCHNSLVVFTHDNQTIHEDHSIKLDCEFYEDGQYCHEDEYYVEGHNGENILSCDAIKFDGEWYHKDSEELRELQAEQSEEN